MYKEFYRLKELPFNVTADPEFFFSSILHHEAISNLMFGIQQRKGIIAITGEVGTGKTTLCRKLLRQVDKKTKFALILNPSFSELDLLQMIAHDLGIFVFRKTVYHLMKALNRYLIKASKRGYNVVLVIDEAQNLSVNQLEQIRLLSNIETEKEKLLQIVLVGQPELREKLHLNELRQLRQRIAVNINLQPLSKRDVKYYIQHRLFKATQYTHAAHEITFSDPAIDRIFDYTQGSPRAINILCDRALLAGFAAGTYLIDEPLIENCAKEIVNCEHHL